MGKLAEKHCVPCRGGVPPLAGAALAELRRELHADWRVVGEHHLERRFELPDFARSLALANAVGALAEREQHHPDLLVRWGALVVTLWSHAVDGLTESDFVLAAKIDALPAAGETSRER